MKFKLKIKGDTSELGRGVGPSNLQQLIASKAKTTKVAKDSKKKLKIQS